VADGKALAVLPGHDGGVTSVAFLPNGRRLASGAGDGAVRFWDVEGHGSAPSVTIPLGAGRINALAGSADGAWVAAGCKDGTIHLFAAADSVSDAAVKSYAASRVSP
jgi:WD40 repeat protein